MANAKHRPAWLWAGGLVLLSSVCAAVMLALIGRQRPHIKATALEIQIGPCSQVALIDASVAIGDQVAMMQQVAGLVRSAPVLSLDLRDIALYDGGEYTFWFTEDASDRIRSAWDRQSRALPGQDAIDTARRAWCYTIDVNHELHYLGGVVVELDRSANSSRRTGIDLVLSQQTLDRSQRVTGALYLWTFFHGRVSPDANFPGRWSRLTQPTLQPNEIPDPWLDLGQLARYPQGVYPILPLPRDDHALRHLMHSAGLLP